MINHAMTAQLAYLRDRVETPVKDFALEFDLAHFGRQILEGFINSGLVTRTWRRSRGFYSLTDEGRERLRELEAEIAAAKAQPQRENDNANSKPGPGQQPNLQGQRSGRSGDRPDAAAPRGNAPAGGSNGAKPAAAH